MKINNTIKLVIASLFVAGVAQAAPVTGSINIVSFADPAFSFNTVLNSVTFGGSPNALVSFADGSYTGLLGSSVNYTSFSYAVGPNPVSPLWATVSGVPVSSFSLTSISSVVEVGGLSLSGTGTVSVAGFDDTVGVWSFTATKQGTRFNWDSINSEPVPDGGATLALLGVSILGLGGARRLLSARKN